MCAFTVLQFFSSNYSCWWKSLGIIFTYRIYARVWLKIGWVIYQYCNLRNVIIQIFHSSALFRMIKKNKAYVWFHLMRIRTEELILFQILTLAHLWISNRFFSSCNKKSRLIKISLMFHHQMILYLNFLPLCFHLKREEWRKEKNSLLIALHFSVPTWLWFFNLSLGNISQVSSLFLWLFIYMFVFHHFIISEKIIYHHYEGDLLVKEREQHLFKQLHSNYLSVLFVH